jgi:hypothetical protein
MIVEEAAVTVVNLNEGLAEKLSRSAISPWTMSHVVFLFGMASKQ